MAAVAVRDAKNPNRPLHRPLPKRSEDKGEDGVITPYCNRYLIFCLPIKFWGRDLAFSLNSLSPRTTIDTLSFQWVFDIMNT